MSTSLETVLARLRNVNPSGEGFLALCPAHDDHNRSLSIGVGDDGRVLLKCFVGCSFERIVESLGMTARDMFADDSIPVGTRRSAITVAELAEDKSLPAEFLQSLGLEERDDGVFVPYKTKDGSRAERSRLRTGLQAKDNSVWTFGNGKPLPYGLDHLEATCEAGYVVLAEGESDLWTLRYHGIPALGIPGASMTKVLRADHLRDVQRVFIIQEPDKGGRTFVDGALKELRTIGWKGEALIMTCGDFKDPNDLHRDDPTAFVGRFQDAMKSAAVTAFPDRADSETPVRDADEILAALQGDSPTALEASLRKLAGSLKGADPLRRNVVREAAIQQLKVHGVKAAARMVDAALKLSNGDAGDDKPSFLHDPTPSPDAVDGEELLCRLRSTLNRFILLPPGTDVAIALWIVFAFCLPAFSISPILAILSPVKRCGKTTLVALLLALVPRALTASNITSAAVFRTIEHYKPTLLIDEADTFLSRNDELRGVINSGHTRSTAMVIRTVGDDHEPKVFSTWCGKAISLIGRLSDTLRDRSIVISMRRKAPGETVERMRHDQLGTEAAVLQAQAARWAADHTEELRDSDPEVPAALHDRAQDNWRPLLAIADLAGGEWSELARKTAIQLEATDDEADTAAPIQLLADIRVVFQNSGEELVSSDELVNSLTSMEDRPWGEWKQGRPLTKIQLSRLLRRFQVSPTQQRLDGVKQRGYRLANFQECFERYLPPESGHRDTITDFNNLENNESRDTVGTVPSRVGTDAQKESRCPDSESGRPDSAPTQDLFESGQPHDPTDGDRDGFDL